MTTQRQEQTGRPEPRRNYDEDGAKRVAADRAGGDNRLLVDRPFDFIEHTKPEDRLPADISRGQITRDNVNPNIPSAEPGHGPIVDPATLGMEHGVAGAAVPKIPTPGAPDQHAAPIEGMGSLASINEPPGSTLGSNMNPDGTPIGGGGGGEELPALALTDISPDSVPAQADGLGTFELTATGGGFDADSVIVFNDEDMETVLVSETVLTANIPTAIAAATVDVEVARGDDLSDALAFEFTAVAGDDETSSTQQKREKKPPVRKPSKGKRPADKRKGKSKR